MAQDEPTEAEQAELAELARRMQDELRSLTAVDVLSQAGVTLVNVAAARMGMVDGVPDERPDEARAAIDALGTLLPVLEEHAPGPLIDDLRAGLAQLRLAFVELSGSSGTPPPPGGGEPGPPRAPQAPPTAPPEPPRAKIWTPGGDV